VLGTLLGKVEEGVVSVTNCFTVPHTEEEQLSINVEFHRRMCKLHMEVSPDEQIVGWYTTAAQSDVLSNNMLISEFYTREMNNPPVLLTVDTTLKSLDWVKCQYLYNVQIGQRVLQRQFRPLRHTLATDRADRGIINQIRQDGDQPKPLSDLSTLIQSLTSLVDMLSTLKQYIDTVISGKTPGSLRVAKLIDQTLALLPSSTTCCSSSGGGYDLVFKRGLQDLLSAVYLANLTKTHLLLASQNVGERD